MEREEYEVTKQKLSISYEYITPDIAKEMMTHNVRNARNIYPAKINRYAESMIKNLWKTNGQTISFYENGDLFDGQSRLSAIIKSKIPQGLIVVRGIANDVTETDMGGVRTLNDISYGRVKKEIGGAIKILFNGYSSNPMEKVVIIDHFNKNPELYNSSLKVATKGGKSHAILGKSASVAAIICAKALNIISDSELEAFCYTVNTLNPVDGYIPDASLCLHKTLMNGFRNSDGRIKMNHNADKDIMEATFKGIKAFKRQDKIKRIIIKGDLDPIIQTVKSILED